MLTRVYSAMGIQSQYLDMTNLDLLRETITAETKLIWLETPTNPLMNITDIEAVAAMAKGKEILVCVDNTFASPYLQNPLDLGADLVMHSVTKYLGGHSDVIQGCLVMNDAALREKLYFIQKSCGAVPGPMDCFLVLRGIKTLHVRMQRHCENGAVIANWLRNNPAVKKVYWPGFEDHPCHAIAKKQMRGFGGMISVDLGTRERAATVLDRVKLFALAESLGGVESLICLPAAMTHASVPPERRARIGIGDGLIRLSCGVEDAEDLMADLEQAFDGLG